MIYLIDTVLVLLFAVMVIYGIKEGFVRMALNTVAVFVAFIIAKTLSPGFASAFYNTFLSERVYESIQDKLAVSGNSGQAAKQAAAVLESIPEFAANIANSIGIDLNGLTSQVKQMELSGASLARDLTDKVAAPILTAVMQVVMFVVLLIIFYLILLVVIRIVDRVFKLPVLKTANRFLGGILGVVKGGVLVFLICVVLGLLFGSGGDSFISKSVESSYLVDFVNGIADFKEGFKV